MMFRGLFATVAEVFVAGRRQTTDEYGNYGIPFCRTFAAKAIWPEPGIWQVTGIDGDKLTRFGLGCALPFQMFRKRRA